VVRRQQTATAWENPKSFATTLVHLFHDEYFDPRDPPGENCYTWHPGTILLEIRDDFGVELPRASFDRLMAGIQLVTSDAFYKNAPTFVDLCNVLAGGLYDPATWDPADATECAWGITEAMLLAPPDDDDEEPFSAEIRGYLGAVLDEEGILDPPDVLRIALRDGGLNQTARVHSQFDDPGIRAAITGTEAAKVKEINDHVRSNLRMLIGQLEALHLAHGDASALAGKLAQAMGTEGSQWFSSPSRKST
jgi:hypothetical protein